jgi:hypothetical protein
VTVLYRIQRTRGSEIAMWCFLSRHPGRAVWWIDEYAGATTFSLGDALALIERHGLKDAAIYADALFEGDRYDA